MVARTSPSSPTAGGIHEYLIEEDEMGDSAAQSRLLAYLEEVLRWLYRAEDWFVARDLTMYHPAIRNSQQMISPDLAVFIGIPLSEEERWALTSWDMRHADHACPPVMFEVSSEGTWHTDIASEPTDKPQIYGAMGVREYFAYDPNLRRAWRGRSGRLLGWRYDGQGQPVALAPDGRGWLWSDELGSWLAPDGPLLHLYDEQGRQRLTEAAAMAAARDGAEAARQDAEAQAGRERRARQDAEAQAGRERRARQEAENRQQEAEAARAEEARRRVALEEELRRLRQGGDQEV